MLCAFLFEEQHPGPLSVPGDVDCVYYMQKVWCALCMLKECSKLHLFEVIYVSAVTEFRLLDLCFCINVLSFMDGSESVKIDLRAGYFFIKREMRCGFVF